MKSHYLLETKISLTTEDEVSRFIKNNNFDKNNYICFFGLLGLLESYTDEEFQTALNDSLLNPLHSKLIEIVLKLKFIDNINTVDTLSLFSNLLHADVTHYFYGTDDATLDKMMALINSNYKQAKIVGYKSAPFLNIDAIKNNEIIRKDIKEINELRPDIIWIGISGWKQDLLMYNYCQHLDRGLMIGVGAVFDLFVGNIKHSPAWMKKFGLRWVYYIVQQPKYRIFRLLNVFRLLFNKFLKDMKIKK